LFEPEKKSRISGKIEIKAEGLMRIADARFA
jgi:hypothetical protein